MLDQPWHGDKQGKDQDCDEQPEFNGPVVTQSNLPQALARTAV
jgi:hypothetical protein